MFDMMLKQNISCIADFHNHVDIALKDRLREIDENEEPINISESVLKNLNEDIYAVNFVVDAFNELKILCENNDKIKNEKFKKLKAKKAWVSLHKRKING